MQVIEQRRIKTCSNKLMVITVPILKVGVLNLNDRIYTQKAVDLMMLDFIRKQDIFYGQIGYPDDFDVHLKEISHRTEKLFRKDGILFGKILILDTPNGRLLKDNLDHYVFRTRCAGYVDHRNEVLPKDFIAIDAILENEDPYKDIFQGFNTGIKYRI